MDFLLGIHLYVAILVSIIFIGLALLLGFAHDEYKRHEELEYPDDFFEPEDPLETKVDEPHEDRREDALFSAESTIAEQTLLDANRQSFRINMETMEAYRRMADAAMRHANDHAFHPDGVNENQLI